MNVLKKQLPGQIKSISIFSCVKQVIRGTVTQKYKIKQLAIAIPRKSGDSKDITQSLNCFKKFR